MSPLGSHVEKHSSTTERHGYVAAFRGELNAESPDSARTLESDVSALVALGGFALTLFSTLSRTPSGPDETSSLVEEASGQLTDNVRSLSAREEEHPRIGDPRPLSVQWDTASEDVGDRWENIRGTAGHNHDEPVSLAGGFASIRETYEAVPSGRLVILGRAGAGKTVLAHRLILALLWRLFENARQVRAPVLDWCYRFYNHAPRHNRIGMVSPVDYEDAASLTREAG